MRSLATQFGPALQAHLSLAFQDLQVYSQRRSCGSEERSRSLSSEEAAVSAEHPTELFQVLLQSQEEPAPCRYLLQEALVQRCPTLAVMAACQQVTSTVSAKRTFILQVTRKNQIWSLIRTCLIDSRRSCCRACACG